MGPSARDLIKPFAAHYRALGVTEWRLAVHFPGGTQPSDREQLLTALQDAFGPPDLVSEGDWLVPTNGILRDRLRASAQANWHLLADADEFQFHPGGIAKTIARCRTSATRFATGLFVDRLGAGGDVAAAAGTPADLDRHFPWGSFLTAEIARGDPRKVTLAHRDVKVGSPGNHFVWDDPVEAPAPMPVHHFKWRAGVREYLEHRVLTFEHRTEPREQVVRSEAERALEFLSELQQIGSDRLATFPASLNELPPDWPAISAPVWRYWQFERRLKQQALPAAQPGRSAR